MPDAYAAGFNQQVEEDAHSRLSALLMFAQALEGDGVERAKASFEAYLRSMEKFLADNSIEPIPVPDREASFDRFLNSRKRMLNDDETRRRQSRMLTITSMPDIWDDRRAAESFQRSFFEDLSYRAAQGSKHRIVRSFAEILGPELEDAETAADALERHLAGTTWTDDNWRQ